MSEALSWAETIQVERPLAPGRFVFVCDHAASMIPDRFANLGLDAEAIAEHIGWDIGALAVARRLSAMLESPLVYPIVSRLVIDCNRAEDHPSLIVSETEFGPVPGNRMLTDNERQRRITEIHRPFHQQLAAVLRERAARHLSSMVIAVHSFTPILAGQIRPWHVGLLYNADAELARRLEAELAAIEGIAVGLNVPYSPRADGVYYTLTRHAEASSLPCVMVELRNDLIRDEAGQALWADRLATGLVRIEGASDAVAADDTAATQAALSPCKAGQ